MAPTFSSKPRGKAVSGKSNVSLLTEGASYFKRAKKAREDRVEKIVFDDDARRYVGVFEAMESSHNAVNHMLHVQAF
jgi:hypothetical protein